MEKILNEEWPCRAGPVSCHFTTTAVAPFPGTARSISVPFHSHFPSIGCFWQVDNRFHWHCVFVSRESASVLFSSICHTGWHFSLMQLPHVVLLRGPGRLPERHQNRHHAWRLKSCAWVECSFSSIRCSIQAWCQLRWLQGK